MVEHGAHVSLADSGGPPALLVALRRRHIDGVEELMRLGVCPNSSDEQGATVLMYATLDGSVQVLRTMLEARPVVDAVSSDGSTVLMYAAKNWSASGARVLP